MEMSQVFIRTDGGGKSLDPESEVKALSAGCVGLQFGEREPEGAVSVGHSTIGWTGIFRDGKRLARFRDFGRALKYAQRVAPQAA